MLSGTAGVNLAPSSAIPAGRNPIDGPGRVGYPGPVETFEFVRLSDGLVYRFHHEAADTTGRPVYRRSDEVVGCRWLDDAGWCVVDGEDRLNGWPVGGSPDGTTTPPATRWYSEKAGRGHLYELRRG